ncbi:uncharacterized protein L201_004640 [Kwoniella dendrophila CBS 6074]|uniref:UDP-N-acetylglucosamine transferase subunit ALG13 n=1 Tax=Kwoniella dendrophila CBS 6074 TaxID=1295534 RepID=A0AAX4JYS1_9TREE
MSTILVTVGSTLFPTLTDKILSNEILLLFSEYDIHKVIIQYGKAEIKTSSLNSNISLDSEGKGSIVTKEGMIVELIRFTDKFDILVDQSDYVISHAGSGSILTTLRRTKPKPLLVVPNETLMDNHQAELADELSEKNYLMVSKVEDLHQILPKFLDSKNQSMIKPFPKMDPTKFSGILDELMGF